MKEVFGKQARLPEKRIEANIGTMSIGASGYTVPWAMWADGDGLLWINGKYTIHHIAGDTVSMLVTRRSDGYEVDISSGHASDYRWSPQDEDGFMGGADALPVVRLTGA